MRPSIRCVAVAVAVGACGDSAVPFDGAFDFEARFEVGDVVRSAHVHVPPDYDGSEAVPLVLAFHGGGSDAAEMRGVTEFDRAADALGFVVAYPEGAPDWLVEGVDDRAFAPDLIDRLRQRLAIDASQVYATGFSRGGAFSMFLGCHESSRFAAIAPVAITMSAEDAAACRPGRTMPTLLMLGAVDLVVPIEGDSASGRLSGRETIGVWAGINDCDGDVDRGMEPDTVDDGRLVRWERFRGCSDDVETWLYVVDGAGHLWPLGDIDPAFVIGRFFLRHRR